MVKLIIGIVIIGAIAGLIYFNRSSEKKPEDFVFMYYPKANTYYHISSNEFVFIDPGTGSWNRSEKMPALEDSLGKYVTLNITDQPVWKNNRQHRIVHGTSLYASPEEVKSKLLEDSMKSIPPKPVVVVNSDSVSEEKQEKKRSGVRRFFDRIFKN